MKIENVDDELLNDISLPEPDEEGPYASFMEKIPTHQKLSISNDIPSSATALQPTHSSISTGTNNDQIKTTTLTSSQKSNPSHSSSVIIKNVFSNGDTQKQQIRVDSSFEEKKIYLNVLNKFEGNKFNSDSNGAVSHHTMNESTKGDVSSNQKNNNHQNKKAPDFFDALLEQSRDHPQLFEDEDIEEFEDDF
jgi:hypothetical protein